LKPGSILPERTTTTGDSLPVMHINAFHIISADVTIIPGAKRRRFKTPDILAEGIQQNTSTEFSRTAVFFSNVEQIVLENLKFNKACYLKCQSGGEVT
jgi:hypothetical protein